MSLGNPDDYRGRNILGCRVPDALFVAFGRVDGHFLNRERFLLPVQ